MKQVYSVYLLILKVLDSPQTLARSLEVETHPIACSLAQHSLQTWDKVQYSAIEKKDKRNVSKSNANQ